MARHRNANWNLHDKLSTYEEIVVAVLMDIRDELQTINRQLSCPRIPRALDAMVKAERAMTRTDKRLAKKISLNGGS